MSALLTCTSSPLPMETVPAIKITHFCGKPKADAVYAYARLYVLNGALRFSLTRFEEKPAQTARMGIALNFGEDTDKILFFSLSFTGENSVCLYNNGVIAENYSKLHLQISNGGDEQGLYYTADGEISAEILETSIGARLVAGAVLGGNIYSYDTTESAFGSAFITPPLKTIPTNEGFSAITCVSY